MTVALPLVTGTVFRATLSVRMWRKAVHLTRGVALAAPGAEGGVAHLALQPGAVVGDAGILVKLAALLQMLFDSTKFNLDLVILYPTHEKH